MKLAPSVLAADFGNLASNVNEAFEAGAKYTHLDVMDGVFVPSISFGFPVISSIRGCTKSIFDIHLMIVDPIRYVQETAECGADIITFHYEACTDVEAVKETIDAIRSYNCKVGIAIKPNTDVSVLQDLIELVDMVLIMTVEPGFGGQKYIPECTDKIRAVRKMIEDSGREVDLEIDGGVKLENVQIPIEAGANVIVAGTAVFGGDIHKNVLDFLKIFK